MKMLLLLFLVLSFVPQVGYSHSRLLPNGSVPPRDSNAGLKTGPCGEVARTATPTVLESGQLLTLQWEEIIDHPGRYEFYFSPANDQDFELLAVIQDTKNGTENLPHRYSAIVELPDIECEACTIQMIQVMTENPDSPRNYYSCGDILLTRDPSSVQPKHELAPLTPPTEESDPISGSCEH